MNEQECFLQFGHGGDAVDDPAHRRYAVGPDGTFNSATAVTPWMTAPVRTPYIIVR